MLMSASAFRIILCHFGSINTKKGGLDKKGNVFVNIVFVEQSTGKTVQEIHEVEPFCLLSRNNYQGICFNDRGVHFYSNGNGHICSY